MNIMLVSVTERTREIGVRKAVGARRVNILTQFIIEAITLALTGGIAGILLGFGVGILAPTFIPNWPGAYVPVWAIVLSFGFSSAVGLFFGIYPAPRRLGSTRSNRCATNEVAALRAGGARMRGGGCGGVRPAPAASPRPGGSPPERGDRESSPRAARCGRDAVRGASSVTPPSLAELKTARPHASRFASRAFATRAIVAVFLGTRSTPGLSRHDRRASAEGRDRRGAAPPDAIQAQMLTHPFVVPRSRSIPPATSRSRFPSACSAELPRREAQPEGSRSRGASRGATTSSELAGARASRSSGASSPRSSTFARNRPRPGV
jgi:hypothetical protein